MKAYWVDDSPKITVYCVQADGVDGPVAWDNIDDAMVEVLFHVESGAKKITLEIDEMTQADYDSLEEFQGY